MAAGLGFKDFTTGEVLTAADVDGYLMQGIWVFASNAARDAAVTAPAEGNFAFTKDTNSLWYYDGAAWVASGATGDIEGVTAGVGISGGGTSGTVTVTNSMATEIAAKGDLIVGTGSQTFDNLTVGTNGHTLVADSAEATGLKWAAPSSGAMTLIKRSSFSNVANTGTTFDDMFSSTYGSYQIVFEAMHAATGSNTLQMQFRYAGPTTQDSGYYGNTINVIYDTATITNTGNNAGTSMTIAVATGASAAKGFGYVNVYGASGSSDKTKIMGMYADGNQSRNNITWQDVSTSRTYTGFLLKSSSTNITGTVAVYGLA